MSYPTETSYQLSILYMIYVMFLMICGCECHLWHLFGIIFPLWSHVATAPELQQMDANRKAWRINLNSSVKIDMTTFFGVFAYQKLLWFHMYAAQFCTLAPTTYWKLSHWEAGNPSNDILYSIAAGIFQCCYCGCERPGQVSQLVKAKISLDKYSSW